MRMTTGLDDLTAKEKETLRLLLRGHDAKSSARQLGLSVHTVNERLRDARRKLGVTSSREAARRLLEAEGEAPETLGDKALGGAAAGAKSEPVAGGNRRQLFTGGVIVTIVIAIAAVLGASGYLQNERPMGDPATPLETVQLQTFEVIARDWLELADRFDWDRSFAAAGRSFRDPNTVTTWRDASQQARVPLGTVVERSAQTVELVQAKPGKASASDKVRVRFATRFENRSDVMETITLEQEYGEWKVVGYVIE